MAIRREIEVTRKGLPRPIDVTYGTNLIPIEFVVTDFAIPEGVTTKLYAMGASKVVKSQDAEVSGNKITFTPEIGFFDERKNVLQIAIEHEGKNLFSFEQPVTCHYTMKYTGALNLSDGPTFVEMVLELQKEVDEIKKNGTGGVSEEQIKNAVNEYLDENPVASGATEEQAAQIEQNKSKIEQIQEDVKNKEESGTAENKVTEHNVSTVSHNDIRLLIQNALNAFEAFMDIDDESMNQATEFVAYMKDNRELIEQITTSKVSVSDIVDDYVTNVSNKPVSAAVAVKLKALIDAITVPTLLSQLGQDATHRTVTDVEKETWNNKANKATTLAGYGITDGATKEEVSQISEQIADYMGDGNSKIISVAHRGAMPTETPENTLVGYAKAKEMGFDYVELDVRLTSDGEIVILHDETINRTGRNADGSTISSTINISDIALSQAKEYVFCGSLYEDYPSVRIPTLEETIALCKSIGIKPWLDVYVEPTTAVLDKIYTVLDKYGMRDSAVLGSSTYNWVRAITQYYSKANVVTRSSTYSDTTSLLNGLSNLRTGSNKVFVNVSSENMETYSSLLRENGYKVVYVTPTKAEFTSVYTLVDIVMSEDYEASEYLVEYMLTDYGREILVPAKPLLDLNRTKSTSWDDENGYLNPAAYDSTTVSGAECAIANLTSNSITVTENGTGGKGVAFPFLIYDTTRNIDRRGKSYTLTWDATGTTDTRFRLLISDGSSLKNADLDNKSGAKTSATIVISADGKTVTVNGTAITFTNVVSRLAFFFGCGTGKTVSYTGVSLVEVD